MEKQSLRLGDPLPRPQNERSELDALTHTLFWQMAIREFDEYGSRLQARLLYHNNSASRKGSTT
jgi:hypothetical protein